MLWNIITLSKYRYCDSNFPRRRRLKTGEKNLPCNFCSNAILTVSFSPLLVAQPLYPSALNKACYWCYSSIISYNSLLYLLLQFPVDSSMISPHIFLPYFVFKGSQASPCLFDRHPSFATICESWSYNLTFVFLYIILDLENFFSE